jgi:phosphatidylinositol alpha-mannosyltransferase
MGADRGLEGITWWGRVDDPTKAGVLSSSALYVAPQTGGESFGIVLIEAMAAGAAVVASDLEAFRSVAGDVARFFPVGNSQMLASVVAELLEDPGERARRAEAGARLAERYDWRVVGAAYRQLYAEVVS